MDLGYLSHFPVLAGAVAKTNKGILELGCGWGSTPMLHAMAKVMERPLTTVDTNPEWLDKFRGLESDLHKFELVGNIDVEEGEWPGWTGQDYDLAFIDFAPGETRKDVALSLKDKVKFIILHDALCDPPLGGGNYQYETIIPKFRYAEFYRLTRPVTLILSNEEPFGLDGKEKNA